MNTTAVWFAIVVDGCTTAGMAWVQYVMTRACVAVAFLTIFPVLVLVEVVLMVLELSGWSVGVKDCIMMT
jgi:membrane-bound metal-dependent hydrolase YbcI (DUF457 family)